MKKSVATKAKTAKKAEPKKPVVKKLSSTKTKATLKKGAAVKAKPVKKAVKG